MLIIQQANVNVNSVNKRQRSPERSTEIKCALCLLMTSARKSQTSTVDNIQKMFPNVVSLSAYIFVISLSRHFLALWVISEHIWAFFD